MELFVKVPPPTNAPDVQFMVAFPVKLKYALFPKATLVLFRQFIVPFKAPDKLPFKVMALSKSMMPVDATL